MKVAAILALIAVANCYVSFDYTSSYDLIEDLKDMDDKIYVLFFYASKNLQPQGYQSVNHHFLSATELK